MLNETRFFKLAEQMHRLDLYLIKEIAITVIGRACRGRTRCRARIASTDEGEQKRCLLLHWFA